MFISLVLCFALFAACGKRDETAPVLSIQYAIDEAFVRRENIGYPCGDIIAAAVMTRGQDWRWEGIANVFSEVPLADRISAEDAIYDAQTLLIAMRQMYGAYIYFGGDSAFIPLFDNIRQIFSTRDYWDTRDFSEILRYK